MKTIEVKLALSDWPDFSRGDVVRVEDGVEDGESGRFISIEKSDGTKVNKYKITSESVESTDATESVLVNMVKYNLVGVRGSNDTGTITFGSFFNYFSWFVINLNGLPLNPRSGSGGGLQK